MHIPLTWDGGVPIKLWGCVMLTCRCCTCKVDAAYCLTDVESGLFPVKFMMSLTALSSEISPEAS
jgi:hypothetical protein